MGSEGRLQEGVNMEKYDIVVVLIAILGLVGTFYSMIYKPLHKLELSITILNETINNLKEDMIKLEKHTQDNINRVEIRVTKHGQEIDIIKEVLNKNKLQ